jgi:chromosomal replication initiation ATPase DnaA
LADDHRTLGDDGWVKEVLEDSDHKLEIESLDELIVRVCQQNDVTEAQLASRSRSHTNAKLRAEIALVATKYGIASVTEIARRFRRSQPVISRAMNRLWDRLA